MPARRLIVDGMNVVGSRPDGWWRDRPGAMRSLVELLAARMASDGEAVTVVFDGRPFELGAEEASGVEVVFASRAGRNAADDDIVALVERSERPGSIRVVTSDDELARRVGALGAEVMGAGAFRRELAVAEGSPPESR
jgi:predicted RNA-binding protein with PIN domain